MPLTDRDLQKKAKSSSEETSESSIANQLSELAVRSDTSVSSMSIDGTIGIQDETPRAESKITSGTETDSSGMISRTKKLIEVPKHITDEAGVEKLVRTRIPHIPKELTLSPPSWPVANADGPKLRLKTMCFWRP